MNKNIFLRIWVRIKDIISLSDYIDITAASQNIQNSNAFKGPNVFILAFAIVIASVGLNVNSIAVIIGAMLISPLMGPIITLGYGLGVHDTNILKKAGINLIVMVVISIFASFLYFLLSPLELENPSELLARTNPTLFDVLIAIFGGFAGIMEICRKDKGTVFSGVAIATALMPPLCTSGYGLATGNLNYFIGALYLFFINSIFIAMATFITVKSLKFPATQFADPAKQRKVARIITILTILIIIPSIMSAISVIKENDFNHRAKKFIANNKTINKSYIYDYDIIHKADPARIDISLAGEALSQEEIEIVLKSANLYGLNENQINFIQQATLDGNTNKDKLVESIFERSDNEILKREQLISQIEKDLREYKRKDIPANQIAKEILAQNPNIKSFSIGRITDISPVDFNNNEQIILIIGTEIPLDISSLNNLKKWLSIRLDFNNLKIINEPYIDEQIKDTTSTNNNPVL